ncbi:MAG: hypothetical protein D6765_01390 [Bacteroidetes bacterium]|nr:MAG: hypothetical protein D6765_01390 [Bacteroidota bacterium]
MQLFPEFGLMDFIMALAMLVGGGGLLLWIVHRIADYYLYGGFTPPPPQSSGWLSFFDPKSFEDRDFSDFMESPYVYDVDYDSETYKEFERQEQERIREFEEQKRAQLTQFYCEWAAQEREAKRKAMLERERIEAQRQADRERVKIAFGDERWLKILAYDLRIADHEFDRYQQLVRVVYQVVQAANAEFGGKFPIKKTWQYCDRNRRSLDLPYWATTRFFFERLSQALARDNLLVGGVGRAGRSIAPKTLWRLKALVRISET